MVVEDKNESQIHYYFPRVYGFIDSAIFAQEPEQTKKAYAKDLQKATSITSKELYNVALKSFAFGIKSLMQSKESATVEKRNPEEISKAFDQSLAKINNNNRVLVHCARGISRSAAIVIMYLMKKLNLPFDSVLFLIQLICL